MQKQTNKKGGFNNNCDFISMVRDLIILAPQGNYVPPNQMDIHQPCKTSQGQDGVLTYPVE